MRTFGIWVGVATLGILFCTNVTLGVIAYRNFRKEKQAAVEAKAPQDAKRDQPPSKGTDPPPTKPANVTPAKKPTEASSSGKDKPPAEKVATPAPKVSETPATDPEFERVWAECVKNAEIVHAARANVAVKPLASLPELKRVQARAIMKTTDTDPYRQLPNTIEFLHHFGLTIWAMHTGALKALQDPQFKRFAAGAWTPDLGPGELLGMAAHFSWIIPELRTAAVEAIRSKTAARDMTPRLRYVFIQLKAEKWLGLRSFEQIWEELGAESEDLMNSHAGVTFLTNELLPPNTRAVVEAAMDRVDADPAELSGPEGEALVFRYNLSLWHQARRARAAVADTGFKRMAKILWDTGVKWKDLSLMTRQFYWEKPATRARVIAAVTGNTPSQAIDPDIRKWLSDHGGKKWLER